MVPLSKSGSRFYRDVGSNPTLSATIIRMDDIFYEIFESLPRQGPGDDLSTKKAFLKCTDLPKRPEILDIGCGTGRQAIALAKLTSGRITALDKHAPSIQILKHNIQQTNYSERIKTVVCDMTSMNFVDNSFDLIWSEGAVFIIGFRKALDAWKPLLRPKGYMAVSELVWFKEEAPQEIKNYFTKVYPDIKYYQHHCTIIESTGYELVDYFPLPDKSWWTDYYTPIERKIVEMSRKYKDDRNAQTLFNSLQLEMEMHRKYSSYYGYGFYIMRKKQMTLSLL
jgi:SAM-dependent methyltransferase